MNFLVEHRSIQIWTFIKQLMWRQVVLMQKHKVLSIFLCSEICLNATLLYTTICINAGGQVKEGGFHVFSRFHSAEQDLNR